MMKHPAHNLSLVSTLSLALLATLLPACGNETRFTPNDGGSASTTAPILGTAESFAVLAGSTVTNSGPSVVTGDLGVYPGTSVTGFPPGLVLGGTIHSADAIALQAQTDATAAYDELAAKTCTTTFGVPTDLGGLTLVPGTYCFASSAQLTGTLTLDAGGDPAAVFVFKTVSTLITASNANVLLTNGAQQCNVFWQVGSSATIGTGTTFTGTIVALTSIALETDASLSGRALARNGAVTMDSNAVAIAICGQLPPTPTPTPGPTATPTPVPVCEPPTVEKTFTPNTIEEGGVSTLVITLGNTCATAATLTRKLSDYFPAGMLLAGEASNTCGGITGTDAVGGKITLSNAAIPAQGTCTVTVDVTVALAGDYCNSIWVGDLQTTNGNNTVKAHAYLYVVVPPTP